LSQGVMTDHLQSPTPLYEMMAIDCHPCDLFAMGRALRGVLVTPPNKATTFIAIIKVYLASWTQKCEQASEIIQKNLENTH